MRRSVALIPGGAFISGLATWGILARLGPSAIGGNRVHALNGVTTNVNVDGSAIGFEPSDGQDGDAGYVVAGAN